MIPADRDGVPLRRVLRSELDRVNDEVDGRLGRIDELVLAVELLEDVVLGRAAKAGPVDPASRM